VITVGFCYWGHGFANERLAPCRRELNAALPTQAVPAPKTTPTTTHAAEPKRIGYSLGPHLPNPVSLPAFRGILPTIPAGTSTLVPLRKAAWRSLRTHSRRFAESLILERSHPSLSSQRATHVAHANLEEYRFHGRI